MLQEGSRTYSNWHRNFPLHNLHITHAVRTDYNSTEQGPAWEANSCSVGQEIPRVLRNTKVHYVLTMVRRQSVSWARSIHSSHPFRTASTLQSPMVTKRTTSFNIKNSTFYSHNVSVCSIDVTFEIRAFTCVVLSEEKNIPLNRNWYHSISDVTDEESCKPISL